MPLYVPRDLAVLYAGIDRRVAAVLSVVPAADAAPRVRQVQDLHILAAMELSVSCEMLPDKIRSRPAHLWGDELGVLGAHAAAIGALLREMEAIAAEYEGSHDSW